MRMLRFLRLCLLSQHERRAFNLNFTSTQTVLNAGNGFGKSAILKSLYSAFGAEPHRVDAFWNNAHVYILLDFKIDNTFYTVLAGRGHYALFDRAGQIQLRTTSVEYDLASYLANILDFKLEILSKDGQIIIPPPDYIFAPFYIDQDGSWKQPWASFKGLYLNNSKQLLAEYHSGLKSNTYYSALLRRNLLQLQRRELESERTILHHTLQSMHDLVSDVVLSFNLEDFLLEGESLLAESRKLHENQVYFRQRLNEISEERQLWLEQHDLVKSTLADMDEAFAAALGSPAEVTCPTCGHHYQNSIADQFEIIQDKDSLVSALVTSQERLKFLENISRKEQKKIAALQEQIDRINRILATRKNDLTFGDIVAAQGRNEALRIIRRRIDATDDNINTKQIEESAETYRMNVSISRKKTQEIKIYFKEKLFEFADQLSVRIDTKKQPSMTSMPFGRGSEGPRGIIAYYYAFLHTARKYSSSAFCPIVIDAPNQQGQDDMQKVMRFIIDQRPPNSQIIVATEDLFGISVKDAEIINIGKKKNQLLDENMYEEVSQIMRPYLGQLL